MTYVCDPENPAYGKVEIMRMDDATSELKMLEFDFGHPKLRKVSPADRVHHSPKECISCHAASEIKGQEYVKPVWPEYFFWSDCKSNRGG